MYSASKLYHAWIAKHVILNSIIDYMLGHNQITIVFSKVITNKTQDLFADLIRIQ